MEGRVLVKVDADVYPTEDPEKVLRAVKNIFPSISFEVRWIDSSARVEGSAEGYEALENLKRLLRERRIRAAARSILKSSIRDDVLVFYLNKQAAYAGKASFTEPFVESPLPPIRVIIRAPDLEEVINWLTE
ncbi:MAG: hypothetical protein LZ169_00265 [Thaumarchaeota archaeon]|nr:hypothetical protein [Candidatus Wolframiiraptor allenii]